MTESEEIIIKFNKEEAIVLFEFLSRLNEKENKELFEDQSEEKMLWLLEGQLEKKLVEPFMPNYRRILLEARNQIRDEE
jgi:hypothetical protein